MPRLEDLGLPSLAPSVLTSFAALGIHSVEDFVVSEHSPKLDEARSESQRQAILDLLDHLERQSRGFQTTWEMRQDVKERGDRCLPTGCESLDKLLEGGLREGTVTELVGGSSSGKTQRQEGSADEIKEAMKSVLHYRIFDVFSMISLLTQIHVNLKAQAQQPKTMRLLIVDCASFVIAPILAGTQGHALMWSMGVILRKLAYENRLAVLITNHTVGGEGGQRKPALGELWKAVPNVRLLLVRDWNSNNLCHVSVLKQYSAMYDQWISSHSCNSETAFRITRTGWKPAA